MTIGDPYRVIEFSLRPTIGPDLNTNQILKSWDHKAVADSPCVLGPTMVPPKTQPRLISLILIQISPPQPYAQSILVLVYPTSSIDDEKLGARGLCSLACMAMRLSNA